MKLKDAEKIHEMFYEEIHKAPCSTSHHLNMEGGLIIHLNNVRDIAIELDPTNEKLIALAWIHDIGKVRTYSFKEDGSITYTVPNVDHHLNTITMLGEVGIILTQEELNAIQFHHGGYSPFANKGQACELAIKLHYCDWLATIRENIYEHKGR